MRYLAFIAILLMLNVVSFSQSVTAFHDIQTTGETNSYTIKTSITGLQGVDIARVTYYIDNTHTYNPSPNNTLFSDRNDKFVKFYIMAVPASGELNVELGITLSGSGEFAFPVEFQYSKNEEKKSVNFPQINIAGQALAVVEEAPTEIEPVVESEENIVEELTVEVVEEVEKESEESLEEKIKAEEETRLAEEQAAAEAKKKEKAIAEQKAKEEAEAVRKAEEEKAIAEQLAAEQKAKEEAEAAKKAEEAKRIAEEKAAKEVEETAVVESPEVVETPATVSQPATSSAQYSIQILSLAEFSQSRLNNYIKQHNLDANQIVKRQVGSWMKISYGKLNSKDEAREMILKLRRSHNITDAFLVTFP